MAIIVQLSYTERAHCAHQDQKRHSIILSGSKDPGNEGFTCHEVELNGTRWQ